MSQEKILKDRLPPQALEAEKSVLGSMLRDPLIIGDIVQIIRPDSFYQDAHQKIYQSIIDLYDKAVPVDVVILAEMLQQKGQFEDVGRAAYLAELYDAAPTAANAEYYARIVRDRAVTRNLIHVSTEILRDAYDAAQPADEMLESAERRILEVAQHGLTGQTFTLQQALDQAYDRIDSRNLGEHHTISGLATGFLDLDEITAGLQNSELVIVAARPSVGKCLAFDSEIVLEDGSIATIEELYRRRSARLMTLDANRKLEWTSPSAYVDDGIKPVYKVTTRLGRTIETTLSHPFLTVDGWKALGSLNVGDRIAVPRRVEVWGKEPLRECEVKLLGYLLGDGGLTDTCPEFTNSNPILRSDFNEAIFQFGGIRTRLMLQPNRTPSLTVSSDQDFIRRNRPLFGQRLRSSLENRNLATRELAVAVGVTADSVSNWTRGVCVPSLSVFHRVCETLQVEERDLIPEGHCAIAHHAPNPLTAWLDQLGLWGKGSKEKFLPSCVFRLPKNQCALLLNRLFATDGWASASSQGGTQIGICSVSEKMIRQIQHLLLRFGIIASIRRKDVKYKDTRRVAWQLEVTHRDSIHTFVREIGIYGKEKALNSVLLALGAKSDKPNRDNVPEAIWEKLRVAKGEESWCSLARRAGLGGHTNIHVGKRGLSRPRLAKLARTIGNTELESYSQDDVYWDSIESIEAVGYKQVYDLTIDETHNFVSNDICVHNTAFSLGLVRNIIINEKAAVFFVSLEQSRIELAERLLCCQARVDSHRLRKGHLSGDDMQKLIEAGGVLRNANLFIDDTPGQNMLRIAANARRLKLRNNLKLVVIDYLQLIEPESRRDPRQEQVAQISRKLKFLAKELQIPVVALAQVNRAAEDRQDHRPRLADLRESGSIEQDADTVMMLHRPERYEPGQNEGLVEVIIAKQRNGPTGEVNLAYIKEYMRFENFEADNPFQS